MLIHVYAAATALLVAGHQSPPTSAAAAALLDTAMARMGGRAALTGITRIHIESMTEWQRSVLDDRLNTPVSSYEWSTELRDYTKPAWRYTRRFNAGRTWREVVDVVTDTVAIIRTNDQWGPLSVAYVDERDELLTFSADRLLPLARNATDLRTLADTTMSGGAHARIAATVNGFPTTLFFNRSTGFLTMARFRAAQARDFGLAGWGKMDVEFRYSRWTRTQAGVTLPAQLDIYRVGRPYKRISTQLAEVNPTILPDSFVVSDSMRSVFFAQQNRAMWDLPMDTAKIVSRLAIFGTRGTPVGAIKLGNQWMFFEGGTAPQTFERAAAFLERTDPSAKIAGTFATAASGQGGYCAIAKRGLSIYATRAAKSYVDASLYGCDARASRLSTVSADRWIAIGGDSVRVESIALPDNPGASIVYAPSLKWAYVGTGMSIVHAELVAAHIRKRGWDVEKLGSPGLFVGAPLPPAR